MRENNECAGAIVNVALRIRITEFQRGGRQYTNEKSNIKKIKKKNCRIGIGGGSPYLFAFITPND